MRLLISPAGFLRGRPPPIFFFSSPGAPIWKLGRTVGIETHLDHIEYGYYHPTKQELGMLEKYTGVHLKKRNLSKMDKVP